ncbi:branched-chain amino acid ABC transporter permease [Capillimicrobium parvum]|uniref:branched-chain amino acid ABC transporter permease n=1 Tax=Capillimicrobium parvum TaxID=2884022 RepID=UPI00216B101E|nr:branched-chain amino acid ABC transporter permease [Capillimicrobium parvum]
MLALVLDGGSSSLQDTGARGLIFLVAVLGLYTFMGNSGVISFGHASFAAIGAYVGAVLSLNPAQKLLQLPGLPEFAGKAELSPTLAVLVGAAGAAVFALVIVVPIVRLSGLAAGLATFSILVIVRVVISNWDGVTRGTQGLSGVPDGGEGPLAILPWALGALAIAALFQCGRAGRRLRASREDEVSARSVGIRVEVERGVAFVVSAAITGAAGVLYAQYLGTFGPDSFYLTLTFMLIAMLIIGGMSSLWGAVLGTIVVVAITDILQRVEQDGLRAGPVDIGSIENLSNIGLALAMLGILILRPEGIARGRELLPPRLRRRSAMKGEPVDAKDGAGMPSDA